MEQRKEDLTAAEISSAHGVFCVCGKLWVVGTRYKLHEHIGAGSYGDVCRATNVETLQTVALKRIPDVFCNPVLAKRVYREVCIMRRLRHPFIISLKDVFTSPSIEVSGGIDVYIATEFATGGDIFHMREPLQSDQVQLLIWQLLSGVQYLHSNHVWHRDIKSENVLLSSMTNASSHQSSMIAKICDFGLSRFAMESSNIEQPKYVTRRQYNSPRKTLLVRPYTKTVVTPSYRAPEVIMSQGQYTSAIDIWALGCIFWELLHCQIYTSHTGPSPQPLFGMRGEPNTPLEGELYVEDGHSELAEQLDVIFDVIGTPCWKDIENVPSESWRCYLKQVPGKAGNLVLNLAGTVDEEALDLLSRMLAFDPARRCTAEEALKHRYFKTLKYPQDLPPVVFGDALSTLPEDPAWLISDPAVALGLLERKLENSLLQSNCGRETLEWLLQREVEGQQEFLKSQTSHYEANDTNVAGLTLKNTLIAEAEAAEEQAIKTPHGKRKAIILPPSRSSSRLAKQRSANSSNSTTQPAADYARHPIREMLPRRSPRLVENQGSPRRVGKHQTGNLELLNSKRRARWHIVHPLNISTRHIFVLKRTGSQIVK